MSKTMTVKQMARLGGRSKSPAKAEASRRNGRLGGRPRKTTDDASRLANGIKPN